MLEPIDPIKRTRVPEQVARRLEALIREGTFKAGEPLPSERVLAQRFGVSRGSVRDAFRRLEIMGLLETRQGLGTFPQELSVNNLVAPLAAVLTHSRDLEDQLFDVRRMFEPAVARVAAARASDAEIDELARMVEEQARRVRGKKPTIDEDTAFHSALARATGNPVLVRIMETLNDLLVGSRTLRLRQPRAPLLSVKGHEAVVEALRARDGDAVARSMARHIDEISALVPAAAGRGGRRHGLSNG